MDQLELAREVHSLMRKGVGLHPYTADIICRPGPPILLSDLVTQIEREGGGEAGAATDAGGAAGGAAGPSHAHAAVAPAATQRAAVWMGPPAAGAGAAGGTAGQPGADEAAALMAAAAAAVAEAQATLSGMPSMAVAALAALQPQTGMEDGAYGDTDADGGADLDGDECGSASAYAIQAQKAATAARSAATGAAVRAFRPPWLPPQPDNCVWTVYDVLPLRLFPQIVVGLWPCYMLHLAKMRR